MPEPTDDALVSRVRLIEDQPLDTRASAFAAVHNELQRALEQADAVGRDASRP
jgi:hypothetical protein